MISYTSGFMRRLHRQPVLARAVDVCKANNIFRYRGSRGKGRQVSRLVSQETPKSQAATFPLITLPKRQASQVDSVLLINARSVVNKLDELDLLVANHKPIVIAITETWLHEGIEDRSMCPEGYVPIRKDRTRSKGGGVAVLVEKGWEVKRMDCSHDHPEEMECVLLSMRMSWMPRVAPQLLVFASYVPPSLPYGIKRKVNDHVISSMDQALVTHRHAKTLIVGDFNDIKHDHMCSALGVKQVVKTPTRENKILDIVMTDLENVDVEILPPLATSDHAVVKVNLRLGTSSAMKSGLVRKIVRPKPEWALRECGEYLASMDWSFLDNIDDLSVKETRLSSFIEDVQNRFFPTKTLTVDERAKPWMNASVAGLIKQRDAAYRRGDVIAFRKLRLNVRTAINEAKSKYYESKVKSLRVKDARKWHNGVRELGRAKKASREKIKVDVNALNDAFAKMGKGRIPDGECKLKPIQHPGTEIQLKEYQTSSLLRSIKPAKCQPMDDIPAWLLKEYHVELAHPVTKIFNLSLERAEIPKGWADLQIIPVPKCKHRKTFGDYRPITILKILPKVLEGYIANITRSALRATVDPRQYGGLKRRSVCHYLVSMTHFIHGELDAKNEVSLLAIDIEKAFNSVNREELWEEVAESEVPPTASNWIAAFLCQTTQEVCDRDTLEISDRIPIRHGVPQGMALALPLFSITVNNLPPIPSLWTFVDDLTTAKSDVTRDESVKGLQGNATDIVNALDAKFLKVNPKKSVMMVFQLKKGQQMLDGMKIMVGDQIVPKVEHTRILGLVYSEDLKWDLQVEKCYVR